MRIDPVLSADLTASLPRSRQSIAARLRNALSDLANGKATIERHAERNWASITFAGTRHTLYLAFEGIDAVEAGEQLIEAMPEHEFLLPGQIVADASVIAAQHTLLPVPTLKISLELLLLEDA